jgi:hypothetical protein
MLSEKKVALEEKIWQREKKLRERKRKLSMEKAAFRFSIIPKIPTSKFLVSFLFMNCTLIEVFTCWVTIKSFEVSIVAGFAPDMSPLVTLIGAVISEVIGYAVYSLKSTKENTVGGIVYESAMRSLSNSEDESEAKG